MRKKIKEPVIKCQKCKGSGWLPGDLKQNPGARNAPHNSRLVRKDIRCPACGGRGEFK